jgi:hypothetical protein
MNNINVNKIKLSKTNKLNNIILSKIELKALQYAENYGIVDYIINTNNNTMVYYDSYRMEHTTYKCIVDLNTMKETRQTLKQYYKIGQYNN